MPAFSARRVGWVYVLHFAEPIRHARHYAGCTHDPLTRMITHAKGLGANLTRVALERSIPWKLAALGQCDLTDMRHWERCLKRWHGSEEHCECCTPDPRAIPGTRPYPLERIQWPRWSHELQLWDAGMRLLAECEE